MKEIYKKLFIDIELLKKEDVVTTSSPEQPTVPEENEHDNAFFDWSELE